MFRLIRRMIYRHLKQMSGKAVLLAIALYTVISWLLLSWSGETELSGPAFFYWLIVTASTVGYGDLSPATVQGQLVTSVFIIPVGLSLFALIIGKAAAFAAFHWRKGIMGAKTLDLHNHILVIGWEPKRTRALLNLLRLEAEQNMGRTICLYTVAEMENPMPGEIEFIRGESFSDDEAFSRACIDTASTLIIHTPQDDTTLAAALYAAGLNADAHLIAYFRDESLSRLLQQHCPHVECTPSVSSELLVKAAMDPGSSSLHHEMVNASSGMTQFSANYPSTQPAICVGDIYSNLKQQYGATLLAVRSGSANTPQLNPPLEQPVQPGDTLFYIASKRIQNFDWDRLRGQH